MPTLISGRFDKDKAEKIYSNTLKGNPAFKPWKGKDGCAWFGYDGNPNPGAAARGKPILIEASVDIPADADVIDKTALVEKLDEFLLVTNKHFPSAEGKLWTWVGEKGERAASGFLVVEVGNTALSNTPGKYLLVNNKGMGKVQLSEQQRASLLAKLDNGTLQKLTLKQQKNEQLHGRIVRLTVAIPEPKQNQYTPESIGDLLVKWAKTRCYTTDPILKNSVTSSIKPIVWGKTEHLVHCDLEFATYNQAKRNARVFVEAYVPLSFNDKTTLSVRTLVAFGQEGSAYHYKPNGNVVDPPRLGSPAWS